MSANTDITALIVVDMQNLFVDLAGASGPAVVASVNDQVASAAQRRQPIYYTRDYAPIDLSGDDPEQKTELHPDLDIRGTIVTKGPGKHGGFSGFLLSWAKHPEHASGAGGLSTLPGLLRAAHVDAVTVVGLAADVCVAATARDAIRLGYPATMPLAASASAVTPLDEQEHALNDLRATGIHILNSPSRARDRT